MKKGLLSLFLSLFGDCFAKDFGIQGETLPIEEMDFREVIQKTLTEKQDKWQQLQEEMQRSFAQKMDMPKGTSMPKATINQRRRIDVSYTLPQDITDHKGILQYKKGQQFHPDSLGFRFNPLILIDGTDTQQVEWAYKQTGKVVLLQGNPLKLEKEWQKPVYFDQKGWINKTFHIRYVPTRIYQEEGSLWVEEVAL